MNIHFKDSSVIGFVNGNYSGVPDLTSCFQNSILLWIPCFLLWILTPAWIYMLSRGRNYITKFSWLSYTKFVSFLKLMINVINFIFK